MKMVLMREADGPRPASVVSAKTEFEIFYRREFSTVAVLAGIVASDRSVGERIAHATLSKARRQWSNVSMMDKPVAWVSEIAIDLAMSRKRARATDGGALFKIGTPTNDSAETRRGDPAVWSAIDQLEPSERVVVALCYLEGLTVSEIAQLLDSSVSESTSLLHTARQNVASILGEHLVGDHVDNPPTNADQLGDRLSATLTAERNDIERRRVANGPTSKTNRRRPWTALGKRRRGRSD